MKQLQQSPQDNVRVKKMKSLRNQIIFIIAFLAVWQIVYQMGTFPELMFPSPGKILNSLAKGFSQDGLGTVSYTHLTLPTTVTV